jgi:hypothetical protein
MRRKGNSSNLEAQRAGEWRAADSDGRNVHVHVNSHPCRDEFAWINNKMSRICQSVSAFFACLHLYKSVQYARANGRM